LAEVSAFKLVLPVTFPPGRGRLSTKPVKIKIGGAPLVQDLKRIEAAARLLPDASHLAVGAIYAYSAPFGFWWLEDICDPLDFDTLAPSPLATPDRSPPERRCSRACLLTGSEG